ncbi:MAG: hypothetical protein RL180_992, partial [Pseudomonadota bacterium]
VVVRQSTNVVQQVQAGSLRYQGRLGPLTDEEKVWAKTAWRYVVNNTAPETGLVNAIDRYPTTTAWHIGDYLASLVAARELGLIDKLEFDQRLSRVLGFLGSMDLAEKQVPNRIYNTKTGAMVNENNQIGQAGWSAADNSRLLVWLKTVGEYYPEYQEYLDKSVLRWRYCNVVADCQPPYHQLRQKKVTLERVEGRMGYQDYVVPGFTMWGFKQVTPPEVKNPLTYTIETPILFEDRNTRIKGGINPVLAMPHLYLGMEFGWDLAQTLSGSNQNDAHYNIAAQATNTYLAQEQRWKIHKIYTARSDHQLSGPPYRLYDSIYSNGYDWNTLTEKQEYYPQYALVSTRVVFSMWALWNTTYTTQLMKITEALHDKNKGWYEGRYEASGAYEPILTLTTNAAVLEALLYKTRGPLYKAKNTHGFFERITSDVFQQYDNHPVRPPVPPTPPAPKIVPKPQGNNGNYRQGNQGGNFGGNQGSGAPQIRYVEKPVVKTVYVDKPVVKTVYVNRCTPVTPKKRKVIRKVTQPPICR